MQPLGLILLLLALALAEALQTPHASSFRPTIRHFEPLSNSQKHISLRGGAWASKKAAEPVVDLEELGVNEEVLDRLKNEEPGLVAHLFDPFVRSVFEQADTNKDGVIGKDEAYTMVLKMYLKINRQAPIEPPPRELVMLLFRNADKDGSGTLTKDEFSGLVTKLIARATIRMMAHKFMTFVASPMLAAAIANLVIPKGILGKALTTAIESAAFSFFQKVLPKPLHGAMLNRRFVGTLLTIFFMSTLGSTVLNTIDALLGYKKEWDKDHLHRD